jgi:hypothetical protein
MKKYENVKTKKQTLIFYSKKEEKTKKYVIIKKIDYQNFIKIRKC